MDRKEFIKTSCVLGGISFVGAISFLESCKKSNLGPQGPTVNFTLDLTQPANSSLNNSGGSVASNGVVVANSSGTYVCIAQSCTHNGCSVNYSLSGNNFVCPCHGGAFDVNGKVTAGPPPAPLKNYKVTKAGNFLSVSG